MPKQSKTQEIVAAAIVLLRESPKGFANGECTVARTQITPADILPAVQAVEELGALARWFHGFAERQCNGYQAWGGGWDQEAADRDEKRAEGKQRKLAAIAKAWGVTFTTGGDPRGAPLYLKTPKTGESNGWAREEGWIIPR